MNPLMWFLPLCGYETATFIERTKKVDGLYFSTYVLKKLWQNSKSLFASKQIVNEIVTEWTKPGRLFPAAYRIFTSHLMMYIRTGEKTMKAAKQKQKPLYNSLYNLTLNLQYVVCLRSESGNYQQMIHHDIISNHSDSSTAVDYLIQHHTLWGFVD